MTGAKFASPITDESLKNSILDQNRALRFHAFVIHR
jgi:hypothetical protein